MADVNFRSAVPEDNKLIMDSWLKSWRESPWAGVVPNHLYYKQTRELIEHLVMRGSNFEVACSPNDPNVIYGWICKELTNEQEPVAVIHCVYVKDAYLKVRHEGGTIGSALVQRCAGRQPGLYTFRTRQTEGACRPLGFKHAPEVARRK
jgi:hypothetical protein